MSSAIVLTFDDVQDVLYAKRVSAIVKSSAEAPSDSYLILNMASDGSVVGVQVVDANGIPTEEWKHHPDRSLVPKDILDVVDRWISERKAA